MFNSYHLVKIYIFLLRVNHVEAKLLSDLKFEGGVDMAGLYPFPFTFTKRRTLSSFY